MAVYVDKYKHAFRRMKMCHMLADSIEELHAMADAIGLRREWFQDKKTPHYDICQSKRALAIIAGAIEIDRPKIFKLIQHWEINRPWRKRRKADIGFWS